MFRAFKSPVVGNGASSRARSLARIGASRSAAGPQRFFASKELRFGADARSRMLAGVERLSDAVMVTLGPKGRNVIIEQSWGSPKITKDGVTVAKAIEFKDRYMNLGAQLVKSVASKTNDLAGDGTTTATVLARAIYVEGCKAVAAGMNPMDLRRGIELASEKVVDYLRKVSKSITSQDEIRQVATISANDDKVIGGLIAEAMRLVGREGVITVQDGKTLDHEVEHIDGMKLDQGFISRYFITDPKTQLCVMEDADLLVYDGKISSIQPLLPILESISRSRRRLVIMAENIDGEALATLILNKLRGLNVCAIKAPGFGDNRKVMMQDIAVLTGATVINEETGLKLEEATEAHLGNAGKFVVSGDDTVIMNGKGSEADVKERKELIRELIERETSDYQREKLQERLARLSRGVAVIKVGGASEVEVNEIKDRITDAVNATRAAVEEGIVPGGGVALLNASKALADVKGENFDQDVGIKILRNAIKLPTKMIASNAGVEGDVVVVNVLENSNPNYGYNAQKGEYVDMVSAGIIDPVKVVRTALVDAASVASLMTSTECAIVDLPQDEKPAAGAGAPGGMPGGMMGGGDYNF